MYHSGTVRSQGIGIGKNERYPALTMGLLIIFQTNRRA